MDKIKRSPEPARLTAALGAALDAQGLSAWAFIPGRLFREVCAAALTGDGSAWQKYDIDSMHGCVAAALRYGEGEPRPPEWAWSHRAGTWDGQPEPARQEYPDQPESSGTLVRLARFARANWYAELNVRLRAAVAAADLNLAAAGFDASIFKGCRYLANSGLPEKPLALAAGLGRMGRNSLIIVTAPAHLTVDSSSGAQKDGSVFAGGAREGPSRVTAAAAAAAAAAAETGSAIVLGLILLPFDPAAAAEPPAAALRHAVPGEGCGSCHACIDACPTGALRGDGRLERELCIQHWTAREGELPAPVAAAWGSRLYGCEYCLEACPHFRPDPSARCLLGNLGPGLPAEWLLAAGDDEMKLRFKGTALGLGWMSKNAFRRNARLALKYQQSLT